MARIKSTDNTTKREVIITEATKLFKEKGYNSSSMRDLADRVGVEAPSLYNHIQSKNELLNIICFNFANRFTDKIAQVEVESLSVIEKIEKLLRFHIHEMIYNYEQAYVSDREWRNLNDPELSNFREMRRGYRRRFAAIVQYGIDTKELKNIDANTAVMIFLNSITAVDQWHRIVHKVSSEELENNMITILINGIKQ
jgi:TetR/AcrR family transcriptional regulator, cholesterol catabolism regulator